MAPHLQVPDLLSLAVDGLAEVVRAEATRVARVVVTEFVVDEYEEEQRQLDDAEGREPAKKAAWEREVYLSRQIEAVKAAVIGSVPASLIEAVARPVIRGIESAISAKKRTWSPTTNMARFTREMYAVVKFSELLVTPYRRMVDLEAMPKMIRSKLYGRLGSFPGARVLKLGSGSGGWVTEAYADSFLLGLPAMTQLVHFSLKVSLSLACTAELRIIPQNRGKDRS